jgi:glycosyl transferase family 1
MTEKCDPPSILIVSNNSSSFYAGVPAALEKLGVACKVVTDGDSSILQTDKVLLLEECAKLQKTARMLSKAQPGEIPKVVAWVFEPVLPVTIVHWAKILGKCLYSEILRFPEITLRKTLMKLVRPIYLPIALFGLGQYSRSIGVRETQFVFEQTNWLEQAKKAGWLSAAIASTIVKADTLEAMGIPSGFAPYGARSDHGQDLHNERDIDVLFLGTISRGWRSRHLKSLVRKLRANGVRVEIHRKNVYGEDRITLLNRTKILLHLHKYPWDTPWMRWYLAAANGVAVVSEPLIGSHPFVAGEDYISSAIENFPAAIDALLKDEAKRQLILQNCRSKVYGEASFERSLQTLMNALEIPLDLRETHV